MSNVTVMAVHEDVVICIEQEPSGRIHCVPNDEDHVAVDTGPLVHQIGKLEEDGILWLEDQFAVPCAVLKRGGRDGAWTIKLQPADGEPLSLPIAQVGLVDHRNISLLRETGAHFLLVDPDAIPAGHWDVEGGIEQVLTNARERKAAAEHARRLDVVRRRTNEVWHERFINPYTFVPFPQGLDRDTIRERPAGHRTLQPDRLSGSITVEWTATTPLLIRVQQQDECATFPTNGSGEHVIPGSSIKGALRSLHETLAGGCLRVLDQDYVPVYRDIPPRHGDWRMAVVEGVDRDRPTSVWLCERVVWAKAADLHTVVGGARNLRTGATVDVDEAVPKQRRLDREEVEARALRPGDGWVALVTDANARKKNCSYFCALGKVGPHLAEVTYPAWERYRREAGDANDVRLSRQDRAPSLDVAYDGAKIGTRAEVKQSLAKGDVVWVELDPDGDVCRISRSVLWRTQGEGPLGERVPPALRPCDSPERLCVSCRIFGSADTTGDREDEGAEQRAYRGHVRISDAAATKPFTPERLYLPSLGAPRPGSGQLYLRHDGKPAAAEGQRPTREWGAQPDHPEFRQVRGRKYYWHGDPAEQRVPRHKARDGQTQTSLAEAAPKDTTFRGTLTFENLSCTELGSLLAALRPSLVLTSPDGFAQQAHVASRIGGGKPLGLGTLGTTIVGMQFHSARSRYLGDEPPAEAVDDLVAAFVSGVPSPVKATWPDLAAVLDVGHVDPRWIWYPPGAFWEEAGKETFDRGYKFWQQTDGRYLSPDETPHDLVRLPEPHEPDQALKIRPGKVR
ncbi:MAG: RAMP superfamily CRISPR-associated protein [Egibacteraceae bacterium]